MCAEHRGQSQSPTFSICGAGSQPTPEMPCGKLKTPSRNGFFALAQRKHWNFDAKLCALQIGHVQSPGLSFCSPTVPTIVVIRRAIANCSAACWSLRLTSDVLEGPTSKENLRAGGLRTSRPSRDRDLDRLLSRLLSWLLSRRLSREPLLERRRLFRLFERWRSRSRRSRSRSRSLRGLRSLLLSSLLSRFSSSPASGSCARVAAATTASASAVSFCTGGFITASAAARAAAAAFEMFDKADATALAAATLAACPPGGGGGGGGTERKLFGRSVTGSAAVPPGTAGSSRCPSACS